MAGHKSLEGSELRDKVCLGRGIGLTEDAFEHLARYFCHLTDDSGRHSSSRKLAWSPKKTKK